MTNIYISLLNYSMKQYQFICHYCNKLAEKHPRQQKKYHGFNNEFCNKACFRSFVELNKTSLKLNCHVCQKQIIKPPGEIKKSKSTFSFCSRSCAATHNNKCRRKSRRSKSEILFFELISKNFPTLKFIENDKTMLDGLEVDIAIPELKIAIEWNGIVHHKPIYGIKKFDKIQEIDKKKKLLSLSKGIILIIIDDLKSTEKYVYEVFEKIRPTIQSLLK